MSLITSICSKSCSELWHEFRYEVRVGVTALDKTLLSPLHILRSRLTTTGGGRVSVLVLALLGTAGQAILQVLLACLIRVSSTCIHIIPAIAELQLASSFPHRWQVACNLLNSAELHLENFAGPCNSWHCTGTLSPTRGKGWFRTADLTDGWSVAAY